MGLSQGELAERLGLAASTISAYERGVNEPDDETKLRIAELFNISLDYLLGAIDEGCLCTDGAFSSSRAG